MFDTSSNMGAASSIDSKIVNQEAYVSKHLLIMKKALPQGQYNDQQIKGRLRQEYYQRKNDGSWREKNSWVLDSIWDQAKRAV
jgi:hypothetical protein